MNTTPTVTLTNGAEEVTPLVAVTMMTFRRLLEKHPMAAYDLAMMARDRSYQPFGVNGQILRDASMLSADGRMHDSTRNIIACATEPDAEGNIIVRSPIAVQG